MEGSPQIQTGVTGRDETAAAERELILRYQPPVHHIIARRVPPDWVDDLVDETLGSVINALREGRLRDPEALPGFIHWTARHVVSNWVRAQKRWDSPDGADACAPPETPDPLQLLVRQEDARAIAACLDQLSDEDRQVLYLSFFEGRTPRDVGKLLRVTAKAVRQRKWRALGRFARLWESHR